MNKELLGFFFIFVALFIGAMYYTSAIQEPFIHALNSLKSSFHSYVKYSSNTIDKHFLQAREIEHLKEKLAHYENNHLVMQQLASEVKDLFSINRSNLTFNPRVELVRTISYEKFGDLNRLWIEVSDYNNSKIYGLVYKEIVAGIVIPKSGQALALLNKDIKCAYSVYIGDKKAPGVAHGNNEENLIVEFIPSWHKISEGDIVTTSGLDNIFYKGLKVGSVISISKSQGYQTAVVKPYYDSNEPNYFHIIKNVR